MGDHLLVLLIIVPLLAAPVCVLLRQGRLAWLWSTSVSWVSLVLSLTILQKVRAEGELSYALGGWSPPWGIEYRVDITNAYVLLIISAISAVVLPYARDSVAHEIAEWRHHYFYAALLLCMTGLLGITITGDAFNVFVFLEISSLSTYALISMGKKRKALTAAYQYLVVGTIGGTFILIGTGLIYAMTGTLNMADIAARMPAVQDTRTIRAALAFLTVGLSIKLAVYPLHNWLPNAYTYAPSAVTAFVASTATKVSFYVLLRVIFTLFGFAFVFEVMDLDRALLPVSLLAIFVASAVAIYQEDLKRLLAYSSVAQIGYMVLGLSMGNVSGLTGGIAHLFNHALMKGGMFLAVGAIFYRLGSTKLRDMRGIGRTMPLTSFAFVIGGFGLIGVPGTVGFISKWYLVLGALERGWMPVAAAMLVSSLLAVIYVWRFIETAYFLDPDESPPDVERAPMSLLVPTWILIAASVWFGIDTSLTANIARAAASELIGGGLP